VPYRSAALPLADVGKFPRAVVFDGISCHKPMSGLLPAHEYFRYTHAQWDVFMDAVNARCRNLRLQPRFAAVVDEVMDKLPDDIIGLHVRRTDLPAACAASDKKLKAQLDLEIPWNPGAQFFLCTDDRKNVEWLKSLYGDRIRWRDQWMRRTGRKKDRRHSSAADAAIDLYCLARTSRIIGTATSSFTDYAALLGGKDVIRII